MRYKIAFIDIDWTILDHQIHDWDYQTIDVLKSLQNDGVLIYLCTARPYDSVVHTGLLDFFHPDGIICTNGGVAFINGELLFSNIIPEHIVKEVEDVANNNGLVLELATNKERYFTGPVNEYVHRYFSVFSEVIPDIRKYQNKEVSAILMFAPIELDEKLKRELPIEMNYLRFDDNGVDVGYFKNTKGDGIDRVLKHLKIDKKYAIGAGDSPDDISMFKSVGLSICMGNGSEDAKKEANIVSLPISEHGLGKALLEIFK